MHPVNRASGLILLLCVLHGRAALAQALVRMTDGTQAIQAADAPPAPPLTDEEEARQIAAYRREAGTAGLRKWFSDSHVGVRATVGEAFDDNILVSATGPKESDVVTTLAAGIGGAVGDYQQKVDSYAAADYQATATLFGRHGDEDAVDHVASLKVQYRWDSLMARIESGFQSLHDTSADLGQRTQRSLYDEALAGSYLLGAYTRIEGAVRYNLTDYANAVSTEDLSAELGADYQFWDKLRLGGELSGGRTSATGGLRENYEQVQLRVDYELTGQIKFHGRLGLELRQRDGGTGDSADPVFSLEGEWTPFDGTTLDLEGYRRVGASGSTEGDDILETGLHFSLRQRLVTRFYAELDGDYTHGEYERAVDGAATGARTDDFYLVRGALGYDFVDWLKVQVFCQRQQDASTRADFSFESTRSGVQVDLAY